MMGTESGREAWISPNQRVQLRSVDVSKLRSVVRIKPPAAQRFKLQQRTSRACRKQLPGGAYVKESHQRR